MDPDIEMDEQLREMAAERNRSAVAFQEAPDDIPGDVDLSETAALTSDMFDKGIPVEPRKSNVYSVRLTPELVTSARDYGLTALDTSNMSEIIRHALERLS